MHMTDTLQKVIEAAQFPIAAIQNSAAWGEIDTPDDLSALG